jgi:hypothetical protein
MMLPLLVALAVAVLVAQLVQIALLVVLLRRGSLPPSITEVRLARLFDRFVDNTTLIVSGLQEDIEALRQELRASPIAATGAACGASSASCASGTPSSPSA